MNLKDLSFSRIVELAQSSDKGIILIASRTGCDMCDFFGKMLADNKDVSDKVYAGYVVVNIDCSREENQWLSQLLNTSGTPIFLFFDKDFSLRGIFGGLLQKGRLLILLDTIRSKGVFVANYRMRQVNGITPDKIIKYQDNLFKAQLIWESIEQKEVPQLADIKQMKSLLLQSSSVSSSFYGTYLRSMLAIKEKDTVTAVINAKKALEFNDPLTIVLNSKSRNAMKHIIQPDSSSLNVGFLTVEIQNKDIGNVPPNQKKEFFFTLRNTGNKLVKINRVITDCDCAAAVYVDSIILPEDTLHFKVVFHSGNPGFFSRLLRVHSDAENSPLSLSFKGEVLK